MSWTDSKVYVELSRETIKNGPEYIEPVTREYEIRLYDYYGRPAYWLQGQAHPVSPSVGTDRFDASSDTLWTQDSIRQRIENRAYELYLSRGRADGGHLKDWLQAEAEFVASLVELVDRRKYPRSGADHPGRHGNRSNSLCKASCLQASLQLSSGLGCSDWMHGA